MTTSAGQAAPEPVQVSSGSQESPEPARQVVPALAKPSAEHATPAVPEQVSATSQTSAAARQEVPAEVTTSAGQAAPEPVQVSSGSQEFAENGDKPVDGEAWQEAEIFAIVEWILDESSKHQQNYEAVDLSKGDVKRGAQIVSADFQTSEGNAKACIACHDVPLPKALELDPALLKSWNEKASKQEGGWGARMSRRQGPNLAGVASKVNKDWVYQWLKRPRGYWHDTNMPNLRLTDQEALDVTAFLMTLKHESFDKLGGIAQNDMIMRTVAAELKVSEQQESTGAAIAIVDAWTPREQTLYVGKKLVKHYGCFGCHQIDTYKDTSPIGTELTEWGSKLIARLAFNHAPIDKTRFDFAFTKLINPRIYDLGMASTDRPLERLKMPRFGLTPVEAADIATFLIGLVNDPVPEKSLFAPNQRQKEIIRGRQVMKRYNCQACHMIEGEGGDIWPVVQQANWRPPDLLGQGAKTNPAWLFKFLKDPAFVLQYSPKGEDRVRPWHSIRMPTFEMSDEETRALVRYFAALSREASDFESGAGDSLAHKGEGYPKTFSLKDPTDAEGKRMVDKTVYSRVEEAEAMFAEYACKSCHSNDPDVPMANRAPNFRHTFNGRLRDAWIARWLWGPYKLQRGTKMPTFFGQDAPKPQDKRFFTAADPGIRLPRPLDPGPARLHPVPLRRSSRRSRDGRHRQTPRHRVALRSPDRRTRREKGNAGAAPDRSGSGRPDAVRSAGDAVAPRGHVARPRLGRVRVGRDHQRWRAGFVPVPPRPLRAEAGLQGRLCRGVSAGQRQRDLQEEVPDLDHEHGIQGQAHAVRPVDHLHASRLHAELAGRGFEVQVPVPRFGFLPDGNQLRGAGTAAARALQNLRR